LSLQTDSNPYQSPTRMSPLISGQFNNRVIEVNKAVKIVSNKAT
jgi:hypothetical protein